jgi:hypothetical protein
MKSHAGQTDIAMFNVLQLPTFRAGARRKWIRESPAGDEAWRDKKRALQAGVFTEPFV